MRVRCAALIVRAGKALFLKYGYERGDVFAVPGGGMEPGEPMTETLRREYLEEVGAQLNIGPLLFVAESMEIGKIKQAVHLIFSGTLTGPEPKLCAEHTTADDLVWLTPEEIETRQVYPNIGPALAAHMRGLADDTVYLGDITPSVWY